MKGDITIDAMGIESIIKEYYEQVLCSQIWWPRWIGPTLWKTHFTKTRTVRSRQSQ